MPPPTRPSLNMDSSTTFDCLILGGGPAGLSAALALSRVGGTSVIFSDDTFRNARAHRAHYTLSRDHQPPAEIRRIGRSEVEAYGTSHFVDKAVVEARKVEDGLFEVVDSSGEVWMGRTVVLATGVKDNMDQTGIEGYADCWGSTIHQCLFCDGIENNDLPTGVLGWEEPIASHNVGLILQMGCPGVTIFGNGKLKVDDEKAERALQIAKARGAEVEEREIERLVEFELEEGGGRKGLEVKFRDGECERVGFLTHKPITRPNARELANALGVEIVSDGMRGEMLQRSEPFGASNVEGVFVAGDAGVLIKSFVHAMGQGVSAGIGVAGVLMTQEERRVVKRMSA